MGIRIFCVYLDIFCKGGERGAKGPYQALKCHPVLQKNKKEGP